MLIIVVPVIISDKRSKQNWLRMLLLKILIYCPTNKYYIPPNKQYSTVTVLEFIASIKVKQNKILRQNTVASVYYYLYRKVNT